MHDCRAQKWLESYSPVKDALLGCGGSLFTAKWGTAITCVQLMPGRHSTLGREDVETESLGLF